MCGIVGYCVPGDDRPNLDRMLETIVHRGPDEVGRYSSGAFGLGVRRLSIIDLVSGSQPIANETRDVHVVLNGEIFNYRELRATLEAAGHRFTTESDTEVIAHGYEDWGDDLPRRLRGMFAYAICDERLRRLVLARDPMGIKPLYYAERQQSLVFASEMKALLTLPSISRRVDARALDEYLSFLYVPEPRSIFSEIRALPPGCYLSWSEGKTTLTRYWSFSPASGKYASRGEAVEETRRAFDDSVRASLVADVPVGLFLSGGMDSTAILSVMQSALTEPVQTFSIGFSERAWDELAEARAVARHFGTNHHEFKVVPDIVTLLPQVVRHFDQPFGNPTSLILFLLSREARKFVKVALSGTGGDEMFGGYPRYLGMRVYDHYRRLPASFRRGVASVFGAISRDGSSRTQRLRRFAESAALSFEESYISVLSAISEPRKRDLYTSAFLEALPPGSSGDFLDPYLSVETGLPEMDRLMLADVNTYLPFNQLAYADRMSMAQSLEVRVPFVDPGVAEVAGAIPLPWKVARGKTKALFREAMTGRLPRNILVRGKKGLNLPIAFWFRRDLLGWVRSVLSPDRLRLRGLVRPDGVENLLGEHVSGKRDHSLVLWALIVLEVWAQLYVDTGEQPTPLVDLISRA